MSEELEDSLLISGEKEEAPGLIARRASFSNNSPKSRLSCWIGPIFFRNPKRLQWFEWVFFVVSVITVVAALVINIRQIVVASSSSYVRAEVLQASNYCRSVNETPSLIFTCESDFTLGLLLTLNICFVLYFVVDGLFREQKFEMLAFVLAAVIICVYVIINYIYQAVVAGRGADPWRLARLVITVVVVPINVILAFVVFFKMGFLVFDSLGANPALHKAYQWTRVLSTMLKLNFELMLSLFLLVVTRVPILGVPLLSSSPAPLAPHIAEVVLVCLLLVASVVGLVLSAVGVYMEIKCLSISYLVIQSLTGVYYVFRIVYTSISWSKSVNLVIPNDNFDPTAIIALMVIVFSLFGLIITIALFPTYIIVMKNYGKGLKEKLFD